jgi:anaphase-promoting complex subunit 8
VLKGLGGPRTLFLRSYATYLAGEKRREEERMEAAGPLGKSDAQNQAREHRRPAAFPPAVLLARSAD